MHGTHSLGTNVHLLTSTPCIATVPYKILRTGEERRSTTEKLASLQLPSIKSSYSKQSIKEWVDGSKYKLDKYVKRLWLTLRDNCEKLDNLGLPSDISTAIFQTDDQFIPILNSACEGKSTSPI